MNDGTPEPRRCEVCGSPLYRTNTTGICNDRRKLECRRAQDEKRRRARGVPPRGRKQCAHPDDCTELARADGLCGTHAARLAKTGELGPSDLIRKPIVILAGEVFGKWTALEDYDLTDRRILCRCECGTERRVLASSLRHGSSKGCGCRNGKPRRAPKPRRPYLEAGEVYGRLTILEQARDQECLIRVRCECGNEVVRRAVSIKSGSTKSCDCLVREKWRTHGQSKHPLYPTWVGILARTTHPDHRDYPNYGGRGITVCERWSVLPDGFLNFVADVGERPAGHTLDRKDNDRGYEPANVQWKTPREQSANRRTIRKIESERDALAARLAEVERQLAEARGALF